MAKKFIGVLTYVDMAGHLRSTPMRFWANSKHQAVEIVLQQASTRYGLLNEDVIDINTFKDDGLAIDGSVRQSMSSQLSRL